MTMQCVTGTHPNDKPARRQHVPKHIFRVENVLNALVHYEQTLSSALHHTSNVGLLQENVTPCCDLPKQNTFPLLLLSLLHWNSQIMTTSSPHNEALQTHILILPFTQRLLYQLANTTDDYLYRRETPWKRYITAPQAAATSLDSRDSIVARSWW
jgi:hypothetical protein